MSKKYKDADSEMVKNITKTMNLEPQTRKPKIRNKKKFWLRGIVRRRGAPSQKQVQPAIL